MGRLILIILIIVAVVLLWKAFGPGSRSRQKEVRTQQPTPKEVMGPDDDPDFLWRLQKQQYDERKRREQQKQPPRQSEDGDADDGRPSS